MKNKLIIFTVCLLITAATVTSFTSCKSEEPKDETSSATETTTKKVYGTEYTYFTDALTVTRDETEYVFTVPPVPTRSIKNEEEEETKKQTTQIVTNESYENSSYEKIDEISGGLSLLSKITEVSKGSTATFVVKGTPNTPITLDLYVSNSDPSSHSRIMTVTSNSDGIAAFTFRIEENVDMGNRKIIIEETDSDNFLQTFVTVK